MTTVLFLKKPMVSTAKIPWQNDKKCFFFLNYNFVTMLQHMVDRTLTFISLLVLHITQRIEFIYLLDIVLLKVTEKCPSMTNQSLWFMMKRRDLPCLQKRF